MPTIKIDPNLYEQIHADYINEDALVLPQYDMYRINSGGQRYYIKHDGGEPQIAPSVTTILSKTMPTSPYLIDWKVKHGELKAAWIMNQSANYGTMLHAIFGRILLGAEFEFDEDELFHEASLGLDYDTSEIWKWYREEKRDIRKDVYGFVKWIKDYNIRPLAIEFPLMAQDGSSAGCVDLVCLADFNERETNQQIMVDYKTGTKAFYLTHALQLKAYQEMWDETNDNLKVPTDIWNYGCANFRLPIGKSVKGYRFECQTDKPNLDKKWNHYLDLFHLDNKFKSIVTAFDEKFTISREADLTKAVKEYNIEDPFKNEK